MEKSQYFNFHPLPLIRSYFEDLEIFSLSVEHSPHSSIILSHLAKAVALGTGRECKKFHLWPQMHLPRLSGVRVLIQSVWVCMRMAALRRLQ